MPGLFSVLSGQPRFPENLAGVPVRLRVQDRPVTEQDQHFWAAIPAGGSGSRLWPLSRSARPKFLLPLLGDRSLLQQTVDRIRDVAPPSRTVVVCGPAHAAAVARQLPGIPEDNVIVEPAPKGTGPAIGLAAAIIAKLDPEAVMGSFAADHYVAHERAFLSALSVAIRAAEKGDLVTIGLDPTRPDTGYGYIERTEHVLIEHPAGRAYRAASFHEKPDLQTATGYLETGRFLWNASMFVWRVATLLEEMKTFQPALFEGLSRIAAVWDTPEREQVTAEIWNSLEASTIDQGVMERSARVAVVPASMGWSDVGDWHGLADLLDRAMTRPSSTEVLKIDAHNSMVWSETARMIALVGLDDIVVVDLPGALLIASRDRAQDVRKVVDQLRALGRDDLL